MKDRLLTAAAIFLHVAAVGCPVAPANVPSEAAKKLAVTKLTQFLKCEASDPSNDQSPCNTFASRGLEAIYGVKDFKLGPTRHMSANQIFDSVSADGSKWALVGNVFDEDNNLCAQALANNAYPVIAVMKRNPHGHIALVIPGEPKKSVTWSRLAANSAGFQLVEAPDPPITFISKPLSNAFGADNAKSARFYYRKG